jgi:hypothetical protein
LQSFLVIFNQSEKRSRDIQGFCKLILLILESLTITILLTVRSESIEEIREFLEGVQAAWNVTFVGLLVTNVLEEVLLNKFPEICAMYF